jgi:hypothetical protein
MTRVRAVPDIHLDRKASGICVQAAQGLRLADSQTDIPGGAARGKTA